MDKEAPKKARTILVTGGAGYIGSHTIKQLLSHGYEVVAFDNLSAGRRGLVLCEDFVEGDLLDLATLRGTFDRYPITAVMHFAALTKVGESVAAPEVYYQNNVVGVLNLLRVMQEHGVARMIFSSSAAIYGDPELIPIPEGHLKRPKSPYGRTKWMTEQILEDYAHAYGIRYIALRYFNAAGSDPEGQIGELHEEETHLIPIVLEAASGRRDRVEIFGTDYDTPDGTCIRDYIHVNDLATAHILALEKIDKQEKGAYNLGVGRGYSVREVIDTCRAVTDRPIKVIEGPRRPGDPARLIADSCRAQRELNWRPSLSGLETIISTAWAWQQNISE
ncbi:MAG: UDP-glucose 4-epimerase GalE [Candidatus Bipolaricaulota bacterium]|nr:UDP-glucose 4-epimerase GalE [Candidatus Bipolaricaulota bacterium]